MTAAYHPSKDEDFVSAAGSRVADSGWGRGPPSDNGGDPLHAVCVQDCNILQQLASPLPTAPTYPRQKSLFSLSKLLCMLANMMEVYTLAFHALTVACMHGQLVPKSTC